MTEQFPSADLSGKAPPVCICIPTYNAALTVGETVASILRQSYTNLVVRVCDNTSTDDTREVIGSFSDPRLSFIGHGENVGAEGNFTRCIRLAAGKYTAIFHADDIYEQEMVARQVAFLEANPGVDAVFTEATMIDDDGAPFGVTGGVPKSREPVTVLDFPRLLKTMLLYNNFLVCPSLMVRTEVYRDEIREWGSELFRSASDVDTWLRLAGRKPIAVLGEPLMRYRISSKQFSHKNRTRTERADFFLVMDHYLARPEVLDVLTRVDLRHYGWLERHERVSRALNLFGLGRGSEARDLLTGLFCRDSIHAALSTRRGLVTLAGGTFLRLLMFLGISRKGMEIAAAIKRIPWR